MSMEDQGHLAGALSAGEPERGAALSGWRFATRIRARRRELKLTLREVAAACASHTGAVNRWERGEVLPRSQVVVEGLAAAFGIEAQELVELVAADRRARGRIRDRQWHHGSPRKRGLEESVAKLVTIVERLLL